VVGEAVMGWLAEGANLGRGAHVGALLFAAFSLANCAATEKLVSSSSPSSKYSAKMVADGEPVPKGGGRYSVGKPYNINGQTYVPTENAGYRVEGVASWYGPDFLGRQTANGEVYDMHSISAAHPTMPLPSYARVTNLDNGRSIVVRVNDRGPYARNRVIDMSIGAAKALEFYGYGLARVRVEYIGRAPLEGSDDRMLMATLRSGSPAPAPSRVMVASAAPFIPGAGGPGGQARLPPERPFGLGMPGAGATFPGGPSIALPRTSRKLRLPRRGRRRPVRWSSCRTPPRAVTFPHWRRRGPLHRSQHLRRLSPTARSGS
jgi:rare lipoprotein A